LRYEDAVRFHGHKGPFMTLGYRAGLTAILKLTRNPFDLTCTVKIPLRKPFSCVLDGIQCSCGCTLGKLNLKVEDSDDFVILFEQVSTKRRLVMRVRRRIIDMILSGESGDELADMIYNAPIDELFELYEE